jgi:hypothetical protein
MNAAKKKVAEYEKAMKIVEEVRKWQKRSKARRSSVPALASRCSTSVKVIRRLQRLGGKLHVIAQKRNLLKTAIDVYQHGTKAKRRVKKPVRLQDDALQDRTRQRLLKDVRSEHRGAVKKHWQKYHLKNPNRGITPEQWDAMNRMSQHW